jgi:hypothetical protein
MLNKLFEELTTIIQNSLRDWSVSEPEAATLTRFTDKDGTQTIVLNAMVRISMQETVEKYQPM